MKTSERLTRSSTGRAKAARRLAARYMSQAMLRLLTVCLALFVTSAAADGDKTFKGRYTWGAEVDAFQPCGSKESYWVSASSWVQGPLINFVRANVKEPYQPIYIEFRGHMLNEIRDGFAESYAGLIRISEIHVQAKDIPKQCKG